MEKNDILVMVNKAYEELDLSQSDNITPKEISHGLRSALRVYDHITEDVKGIVLEKECLAYLAALSMRFMTKY